MNSSASPFQGQPSSAASLIVRHVEQSESGPRLAKIAIERPTLVQLSPGAVIIEMRSALNLRRSVLAREVGLHDDTLKRWERDRVQFDRADLIRHLLARAGR